MKTKEELNALKNEFIALNKKLAELSREELLRVTGGDDYDIEYKKDGKQIEDLSEPGEYTAVITGNDPYLK